MVEKQEILTQEGYNKIEEEVEYLKKHYIFIII